MNNYRLIEDRLIEDCDVRAIKELDKISLLLESDPDLIELMSWDELQTEILELGLDVNRPLLLAWPNKVIKISAGRRNSVPMPKSRMPTPEDEPIEKEENRIWHSRISEVREKVRRVINEDVVIACLWGKGEKIEQIAKETGKSVRTVYRKLGKMQKSVIEELGIEQVEENRMLIKEGLKQLFTDSLKDHSHLSICDDSIHSVTPPRTGARKDFES